MTKTRDSALPAEADKTAAKGTEGTIEATPAQLEIERIIKGAKSEGTITAADLAEKVSTLDLTPDDTDAIYQRLIDMGVDVVEDEAIGEEDEDQAVEQVAAFCLEPNQLREKRIMPLCIDHRVHFLKGIPACLYLSLEAEDSQAHEHLADLLVRARFRHLAADRELAE